jgi:hypothetical protein
MTSASDIALRWVEAACVYFWRAPLTGELWAPLLPVTLRDEGADMAAIPGAIAVRIMLGEDPAALAAALIVRWRRLSPEWAGVLAADEHPLSQGGAQLWRALQAERCH